MPFTNKKTKTKHYCLIFSPNIIFIILQFWHFVWDFLGLLEFVLNVYDVVGEIYLFTLC